MGSISGCREGSFSFFNFRLFGFLIIGLNACAPFEGYPERVVVPEEEVSLLAPYSTPEAITKCLDNAAIECRNRIIATRMHAIDVRFSEFEENLFRQTRTGGFYSTLATLGLTTTGAFVSGGASQVLSGIAALIIGGREAFQKEVLAERTVVAIHTAMRARRAQTALRLRIGLGQPIDQYPLALGLADLNQYYDAGTILGALVGITETVGAQAAAAEEELLIVTSVARTSSAVFLQGLLASAGRDVARAKEVQARIRAEMDKQGVGDIAVADFVRRPDPEFDRQRQAVAKALGWTP